MIGPSPFTKTIHLRVTAAQYKQIAAAATRTQTTKSKFLRWAATIALPESRNSLSLYTAVTRAIRKAQRKHPL